MVRFKRNCDKSEVSNKTVSANCTIEPVNVGERRVKVEQGAVHCLHIVSPYIVKTNRRSRSKASEETCPRRIPVTDRRVTNNDLAQRVPRSNNSAVEPVDRPHQQGFVARNPRPWIRRSVYLRVTVRG